MVQPKTAGHASERVSNAQNDVGHDLILLCAGEDRPVEARPQEGQPAPQDPAAPNLISTSTAAQSGGVDTDVMESEDIESAVSSRAHATAAPIRPFVTGGDETMEQDGPESKRQRTVAGLPVCSLLTPVDEIPVSNVATHETDDRPVCDHKTGERLSRHLVALARGRKVKMSMA